MVEVIITPKQYPEEAKQRLDKMLLETENSRKVLDALDEEIRSFEGPSSKDMVTKWARLAIGNGNYLRKKLAKLVAALRSEEANRYLAIKLEATTNGTKVTESAAQVEATAYVSPIRLARNVLEAYVVSSDGILSVCRLHLQNNSSEIEL
jgi:hypothetical protein